MSGFQKKWRRPEDKNSEVIVVKPKQKEKQPTNRKPKETISFDKAYRQYLEVLKTIEYSDYLQTEHWLWFRKESIRHAMGQCQLCGDNKSILNVHHKTYANRGRETFLDVIVLCKNCHETFHEIKNKRGQGAH